MNSDNIFTLENVKTALSAYDYEQQHDKPVGWCIEQTRELTEEQICASLQRVDALDLIWTSPEIVREIGNPTSSTWQFLTDMATSPDDLAVSAVALSGALMHGNDYRADLALAHLSGKALLMLLREHETMASFEDLSHLEDARKRRQAGGRNRSEKLYGAIRLQCQVWARDIIERHKKKGRKELTKANLAKLVDDKYREFILGHPEGTDEFRKLHPGTGALAVAAGVLTNGSIYKWVKDMVPGQRRNRKNPA